MIRPFLIAVQFLTLLPVQLKDAPNDREVGYSLLYYPLVGLLIGVLLVTLAWTLSNESTMLSAALLLTAWVLLTGGLHLDGLADSADAWVGGRGSSEKTLAIMKDPNCGPAGVVAIVLVLMIKFAALHAVIVTGNWSVLLFAPVLGRTALPLLFLTTPYVRRNGLGSTLASHMPRRPGWFVIAVTSGAILVIVGTNSLWILSATIVVILIMRAMMMRRISGTTGDTAGALVEITETAVLVTASLTV